MHRIFQFMMQLWPQGYNNSVRTIVAIVLCKQGESNQEHIERLYYLTCRDASYGLRLKLFAHAFISVCFLDCVGCTVQFVTTHSRKHQLMKTF